MIVSFRHKGLKLFHAKGDARKLRPDTIFKIRLIPTVLESAATIESVDLQGLHLHALKGDMRGPWSVSVSKNWRLVFGFDNGDAYDLDLVDYH